MRISTISIGLIVTCCAAMACSEGPGTASGSEVGIDTMDSGPNWDREAPESREELTFVFKNATNDSLYVQQGPECAHRGPGWVLIESRFATATKYLTSSCPECSCREPDTGLGCECACSESRRSEQTEHAEVSSDSSVSWTWSGEVFAKGDDDGCDEKQLPPAKRLVARFCWHAQKSSPEGCKPVQFTYGEKTRLRLTISPE